MASTTDLPAPFLLAKLTVRSRKSLVPAVTDLVREAARAEGLPEDKVIHLQEAALEASMNAIVHAYEGRESETYDVSVERLPGRLVVAVEDHGLPFDWDKACATTTGLGTLLMRAFTDKVHFVNLGKAGKRVEIIQHLHHGRLGEKLDEAITEAPPAPPDAPLDLRPMKPEDVIAVERCFYRVYGYTYADFIYHPETIRESLKQGLMLSQIAATPEGEVVGHISIVKEAPGEPAGEIGRAVVDPRYRGHHLFSRLADLVVARAREQGMTGIFGDAVTVHPFSQKAMLQAGSLETGVLLGFIPGAMSFRGISNERPLRYPTVLYYLRINQEPDRVVFLPERHRAILGDIYSKLGLRRQAASASGEGAASQEEAAIDLQVIPDFLVGVMVVRKLGSNAAALVKAQLKALCLQRFEEIFLDIPLSDPGAPALCQAAEEMGFFFGGVIPELRSGDVLRLQYLNNAETGGDENNLVSEFGKSLYRYVKTCQA